MIDLQIGRAIIPVLSEIQCKQECMNEDYRCPLDCCKGCVFQDTKPKGTFDQDTCELFACNPLSRKDGKNVVFKLVDLA